MGIDLIWLIIAVAAIFALRAIYRNIRYIYLLQLRRRRYADRPAAVLHYVSQPLSRD